VLPSLSVFYPSSSTQEQETPMNVLKSETFGQTDIGGRANNEDAFAIHRDNNLLVVADGMGGHQNGEMASATACQSLAAGAAVAPASFDSTEEAKIWLCQALQNAHQAVVELNNNDSGLQRMGTTATLSLLQGSKLLVAWVGDSRVYRLRRLQQLGGVALDLVNDDHVVKYELWRGGHLSNDEWNSYRRGYTSNVITRSLGSAQKLDVDFREVEIAAGDVILSCSDGLNNSLTDDQLIGILSSGKSAQLIVEELIKAALAAKARDNVTAVVSVISAPAQK
jgi:serine/threonine protein phosphatase PrpC